MTKQKILIRLPGRLSDMVQSLPLIEYVSRYFPQAHIAVLVQKKYKAIFRNICVDEVVTFEKKPRFAPILESGEDVISFIQKQDFDLGILLPRSFSSAYLFYQGMVKRRIGFARPFGSFMLTDRVEGDEYSDLLAPLGIKVEEWSPKLFANRTFHSGLHIGIHCGDQNERCLKKWYKELVAFIKSEILYCKITIFTTKESLEEKIDAIHNLDVLVTDDKGFIEVASAVSTPSVNVCELLDKEQMLPEDFFYQIKEAILLPLQDRSAIPSYTEYLPISKGVTEKKVKKTPLKVGVVILAGGMGRRLGFNKPKGLLQIGSDSLFDILLHKAKGAEKIGILTSPMTFSDTQKYLGERDVDLFEKKVYPIEEGEGVSPEGNGALFDALVYSSYWQTWKDLDIISVIAVDNPLADPLDTALITTDKELAVIGVSRAKTEEKLGVLCKKGINLAVREYFTLGKEGLEGLGYSGSFAAAPSFFEKVAAKKLPFYRVQKKGKAFYERLLIDGFVYAKDFEVIEKNREECFFPIKEKKDFLNYCNREGVSK